MKGPKIGLLIVLALNIALGVMAAFGTAGETRRLAACGPTPTGTATPIATSMITTRTVTGPQSNPTLRTDCDFYFANWGESRWPGTKLRPWSYQGFYLRRNLSGKVVCGLFDADVNRIVNGR